MSIDRKYLKISEVADLCHVKVHILRYWEKQFEELSPTKRNSRRYYQKKDVDLVLEIKDLLMVKKYTLSGAKKIISANFGATRNRKNKNQSQSQAINSKSVNSNSQNRLFDLTESDSNQAGKLKSQGKIQGKIQGKTQEKSQEKTFKQQKLAILKELKAVLADLRA